VIVESESIVVDEYHQHVYDVGDLVHRAFREPTPGHREMRLIPCIARWLPSNSYRVVGTYPTCVACIAVRVGR
jgi:hypothetical protein